MITVKKEEEETDEEHIIECVGVIPGPSDGIAPARTRILRDSDVLFVHGETTLKSPGNAAYQKLIDLNRGLFANANSIKDKLQISKSIVSQIGQNKGRFFERDNEPGIITSLDKVKCKDVSDRKAAEFTLKALGEGSLKQTAIPSSSSFRSEPAATPQAKPGKAKNVKPSLLIKLTAEQASNLKYPPGCLVWYNINLDGVTRTQDMSSVCDASVGCVKSISMDVPTRNVFYEVTSLKNNTASEGLVLEDNMCYASESLVHVKLEHQMMKGQIITWSFSSVSVDSIEKKLYMVKVHLKGNQIRILQNVNEDIIKHRHVESEQNEHSDQQEATKMITDTMKQLQGEMPEETKQKATGSPEVILENACIGTAPKIVHPTQTDDVASSITDVTYASSPKPVASAKALRLVPLSKPNIAAPVSSSTPRRSNPQSTASTAAKMDFMPAYAGNRGYSRAPVTKLATIGESDSATHVNAQRMRRWVPPTPNATEANSDNTMVAADPVRNAAAPVQNTALKRSNSLPSSSNRGYSVKPDCSTNSLSISEKCNFTTAIPRKRLAPPVLYCRGPRNARRKAVLTGNKGDYLRLLATLSEHAKKSNISTANKEVKLPSWLVAHDASMLEDFRSLSQEVFKATGCMIRIDDQPLAVKTHVFLSIPPAAGDEENSRLAIEIIENKLIKVIGAEESKGRLLYDVARSFGDVKYDGAVLQRNPLNSYERVWMTVVEVPNEMIREGKILTSPFRKGEFQDSIHQAKCTLLLGKDNFGVSLVRCRPYVLVIGKQVKNVDRAVATTKKAMKQFAQEKEERESMFSAPPMKQCAHEGESPRRSDNPWARRGGRGGARKIVFPPWLVCDSRYQEKIQDGLFGSEWCKTNNFQNTGCELILSQPQHGVMIMPSSSDDAHSYGINRATYMVEDALIDVLGASDSKYILLYDLTKSYSLDDFIQIRNPLNSEVTVWANVTDLPHCSKKVWMTALLSKQVHEKMHKLGCLLKICTGSFSVKMCNHSPYVMVMGRHRSDSVEAFGFVKRLINKHHKRYIKQDNLLREPRQF